MLQFIFGPVQTIDTAIGLGVTRVIHQTVVLEWVIVGFTVLLNLQHDIRGGIPDIHQDLPEGQAFLINPFAQQLQYMRQFALPFTIWSINAIVNDPELVGFRIDIHASNDTDAFDDPMRISAILPPYQFNAPRKVLIDNGIIKDYKALGTSYHLVAHMLPHQPWANFLAGQIAIGHVMAELFDMFGIVGQRIIDLAHQQILTVLKTSHSFGFYIHASTLTLWLALVNLFVLRRS